MPVDRLCRDYYVRVIERFLGDELKDSQMIDKLCDVVTEDKAVHAIMQELYEWFESPYSKRYWSKYKATMESGEGKILIRCMCFLKSDVVEAEIPFQNAKCRFRDILWYPVRLLTFDFFGYGMKSFEEVYGDWPYGVIARWERKV